MLGLVAPYAYKNKIKTHYIASSYDETVKKIECASDPTIDNNLKMGSCGIFHDAFGFSRMQKVKDIIDYSKSNDIPVKLRVCWAIKDGTNCCNCEKCYRTICEIIVSGGNPKDMGFDINEQVFFNLRKFMALQYEYNSVVIAYWRDIQQNFIQNKKQIKKNFKYYKYLTWLKGYDFNDREKNKFYKRYKRKLKFYSIACKFVPRKIKDKLKKYIKI